MSAILLLWLTLWCWQPDRVVTTIPVTGTAVPVHVARRHVGQRIATTIPVQPPVIVPLGAQALAKEIR